MEKDIQTYQGDNAPIPYTAADLRKQVNLIQQVMAEVMQGPSKENPNGVHYGLVPGCGPKPTLLKPGAEKLAMTFRLRPIIDNDRDIAVTELTEGHREYRVYCHIYNMNGVELATGLGSCSTMESKYRYRGEKKEGTGKPLPKEYWDLKNSGKTTEAQKLIGGPGFAPGKIGDHWEICVAGNKMENPDIADTYNTVLKMAKKRAFVDGILSATAASDIFTQDVEDLPQAERANTPPAAAAGKPQENGATEKQAMPSRKSESTGKVMEVSGLIIDQRAPNAGGFVSYMLEGIFNKDNKLAQFSTKDKGMIETLNQRRAEGRRVTLTYTENANPKFANSIIELIANTEDEAGDAQE